MGILRHQCEKHDRSAQLKLDWVYVVFVRLIELDGEKKFWHTVKSSSNAVKQSNLTLL
jgi:hypothetical protein